MESIAEPSYLGSVKIAKQLLTTKWHPTVEQFTSLQIFPELEINVIEQLLSGKPYGDTQIGSFIQSAFEMYRYLRRQYPNVPVTEYVHTLSNILHYCSIENHSLEIGLNFMRLKVVNGYYLNPLVRAELAKLANPNIRTLTPLLGPIYADFATAETVELNPLLFGMMVNGFGAFLQQIHAVFTRPKHHTQIVEAHQTTTTTVLTALVHNMRTTQEVSVLRFEDEDGVEA